MPPNSATTPDPTPGPHLNPPAAPVGLIHLPAPRFLAACLALALILAALGRTITFPPALLAAEVFSTVIALFALGSFRYRLDKNALTFGAGLITLATFLGVWSAQQGLRGPLTRSELLAWLPVLHHYLFTFHGLDSLIHLDTMLFILGLTFFVSVVSQTRLLEGITFTLLRRNGGRVLPTILAVTAVVAVAAGIFDGVSMIGLTIRTLVIILLLARAPLAQVRHAVIVCTVVTTVCGMWLAYGEPPNLIMKANVRDLNTGATLLTDGFFLRYCLPGAILSFICVAWNLRRGLAGLRVDMANLDVLDQHAATLRFLQAVSHGRVPTPIEVVEDHAAALGPHAAALLARLKAGEPLGLAMVREGVETSARLRLLSILVTDQLAASLDAHYRHAAAGDAPAAHAAAQDFLRIAHRLTHQRARAQFLAGIAAVPFVALLVWHGLNHRVPLFLSSFAGFAFALLAVWRLPRLRRLALREAQHEFAEYYFLFPLFLAIALLANVGFFDQMQSLLAASIAHAGHTLTAIAQFFGLTLLSALLDNNVVADFASHALHDLPVALLHLFAMAQIAGYATGGCLTHIGSAQSVVAYAFIHRDLDEHYSPIQWVREMLPLVALIAAALTALIVLESLFLWWLA